MNRLSFVKAFSKLKSSIKLKKPAGPVRYLSGLTLGVFVYAAHSQFLNSKNVPTKVQMVEAHVPQNELIGLSKGEYYSKVMGNEKDFYFLIIYNESEENGRATTRIGKHLKKIADENGFQGWNIYTINRPLFENMKNIDKERDTNIYAEDSNPYPIEIYLKTPYSQDYIFLPYRPTKFFEYRSSKKILRKMQKVRDLIEYISDEEDLNNKLVHSLNKLNTPTLLVQFDDADKEKYREAVKEYSKLAVKSLEHKLLPFDSNFIVVKNGKLGNKLGIEKNKLYALRNDVVQAYERFKREEVDDRKGYVEVETQDFSSPVAYLQKYGDNQSQISLFGLENEQQQEDLLSREARRKRERVELKAFVNFAVPKVVLLREMKRLQLGQLIRKCAEDKDKYVLSLYCPSTDPERERKLAIFMDLYRRYKDQFIFCIVESEMVVELFPHAKSSMPCFVLFNFMNQRKDYPLFEGYYPSINYPYEKYFLNTRSPGIPDAEEVRTAVEVILEGGGRVDFLSMEDENVQELRGVMTEGAVERLKKANRDGLVQFYDHGARSREWGLMVNRLSEDFNKRVKFLRMESVNTSPYLPILKDIPKLVYISNKRNRMYVLGERFGESEDKLREFIKEVSK